MRMNQKKNEGPSIGSVALYHVFVNNARMIGAIK